MGKQGAWLIIGGLIIFSAIAKAERNSPQESASCAETLGLESLELTTNKENLFEQFQEELDELFQQKILSQGTFDQSELLILEDPVSQTKFLTLRGPMGLVYFTEHPQQLEYSNLKRWGVLALPGPGVMTGVRSHRYKTQDGRSLRLLPGQMYILLEKESHGSNLLLQSMSADLSTDIPEDKRTFLSHYSEELQELINSQFQQGEDVLIFGLQDIIDAPVHQAHHSDDPESTFAILQLGDHLIYFTKKPEDLEFSFGQHWGFLTNDSVGLQSHAGREFILDSGAHLHIESDGEYTLYWPDMDDLENPNILQALNQASSLNPPFVALFKEELKQALQQKALSIDDLIQGSVLYAQSPNEYGAYFVIDRNQSPLFFSRPVNPQGRLMSASWGPLEDLEKITGQKLLFVDNGTGIKIRAGMGFLNIPRVESFELNEETHMGMIVGKTGFLLRKNQLSKPQLKALAEAYGASKNLMISQINGATQVKKEQILSNLVEILTKEKAFSTEEAQILVAAKTFRQSHFEIFEMVEAIGL